MAQADKTNQSSRILEQIEDLLEGRSRKDINYYQINGRQLNKIPIADLLKLKAHYTNVVLAQQGQSLFGTVTFE